MGVFGCLDAAVKHSKSISACAAFAKVSDTNDGLAMFSNKTAVVHLGAADPIPQRYGDSNLRWDYLVPQPLKIMAMLEKEYLVALVNGVPQRNV